MPVLVNTPNNNFSVPTSDNDGNDLCTGILDLADGVDGMWSSGTLAGRPAAGTRNRLYYATDALIWYFDNGSAWQPIIVATAAGVVTLPGALNLPSSSNLNLGNSATLNGDSSGNLSIRCGNSGQTYIAGPNGINVYSVGDATYIEDFLHVVDGDHGSGNGELEVDGATVLNGSLQVSSVVQFDSEATLDGGLLFHATPFKIDHGLVAYTGLPTGGWTTINCGFNVGFDSPPHVIVSVECLSGSDARAITIGGIHDVTITQFSLEMNNAITALSLSWIAIGMF